MLEKNVASAIAYYDAMNNKDINLLGKYLHSEVQLISPLAELKGKEAVINSVNHFCKIFDNLKIRSTCGNGNQVMVAYNLNCPVPFGVVRGAVLLTFQDGLIIGYELFYDARPFEKKSDEIFSQ